MGSPTISMAPGMSEQASLEIDPLPKSGKTKKVITATMGCSVKAVQKFAKGLGEHKGDVRRARGQDLQKGPLGKNKCGT